MTTPGGSRDFGRGERIGKYEILTRLSVGGMAELFLAFTAGPGGFRKFVTLKRILPDLREEEEFVAMFLDEARISASLSHSNIAQVYDLGQEGEDYFIAMEFVPGQDLAHVVRAARKQQRELPIGYATKVVRDLALALNSAHHFTGPDGALEPIVHRDVSPKNVMVSYSGAVKVIDFGIAKARGRLGHTRAGLVKGSTSYMSPEQLRSEELDGRSDLFSAAIILYELLVGRPLFTSVDEQKTTERILNETLSAPAEFKSTIPKALSDVVLRALSRDRELRFATGRELAKAIEEAAGGQLFDDEATGDLMGQLFKEQREQTIALLRPAGDKQDTAALRKVARTFSHTGNTPSEGGPAAAKTPATRATIPATPRPESRPGPATILVVDDSATSRALTEIVLKQEGFAVITSEGPTAALARLGSTPVDLILLDVMMPEMDGFELCRRIRESAALRYLPILFLSSACSVEERVQGLTAGADDFVRKPFEPTELVARVRSHLQRVALLRERR